MLKVYRALTIAGSDSGGGAGIQADLKTFTVLGVWGMTALTAVTAQNTLGVQGIYPLPDEAIATQIDSVVTDIGVDALKTGMLASPRHVEVVADKIKEHGLTNLVVDPVMIAKGGAVLTSEDARDALRRILLPYATVVTPNVPEAEVLSGISIKDVEGMREAARRIHALGARSVLVKGGHMPVSVTPEIIDVFFDGSRCSEISGPRYDTSNTHGTGCSLSAAITAFLARGESLPDAVHHAREYIGRAIRESISLGSGHGPTNPWAGANLKLDLGRGCNGGSQYALY